MDHKSLGSWAGPSPPLPVYVTVSYFWHAKGPENAQSSSCLFGTSLSLFFKFTNPYFLVSLNMKKFWPCCWTPQKSKFYLPDIWDTQILVTHKVQASSKNYGKREELQSIMWAYFPFVRSSNPDFPPLISVWIWLEFFLFSEQCAIQSSFFLQLEELLWWDRREVYVLHYACLVVYKRAKTDACHFGAVSAVLAYKMGWPNSIQRNAW